MRISVLAPSKFYLRRSCATVLVLLLSLCLVANAGRVPNLQAKDLAGSRRSLSSLRGKIVVLNFWATWCGPCQEEMPRLSALAKKYSDKDVEFVAVSIDAAKDRPKIQPFLDSHKIAITVWVGSDSNVLGDFGLGEIVPGTVILDRDGQAISRIKGEAKDEDIEGPVEWLIGGQQGPAPKALVKRY